MEINHQNKYAWTVRVGDKGQIVIPKEARELFGFKPGDTIVILGDSERGLAIPPQRMFSEVVSKIMQEKENE